MDTTLFIILSIIAMADIILIAFVINRSKYYEEIPDSRQATKEEMDHLFDEADIYNDSKRFEGIDYSAN